jgi:outer membrane biosynthesis protein TonB
VRAVTWSLASAAAYVAVMTGCAAVTPLQPPPRRPEATPLRRAVPVEVAPAASVPTPHPSTPAAGSAGAAAGGKAAAGAGAGAPGANAASAPPPELLSPFDDGPVIFTVAGEHFTRGERVIVTVCLAPDHTIARAYIFESSGDSKFDAQALQWAQRVGLRAAAKGEQLATCGAVRVEVRPAQEPRVFHAPGDSLS